MHVLRAHHRDAARQCPVVHRALHRRSQADLDHSPRLDQPFLDGVIEHRAVRIGLTEIVGPGVHVRIEVDERRRSLCRAPFFQRAQQRQRDAVLAAERHQVPDRTRLFLDAREARRDVAQRDRKIADIRDRQGRGVDPVSGMIAVDQHAARVPDRAGPEARAAAIGGADVERDPGDADLSRGVATADPEERRRDGKGGRPAHGASVMADSRSPRRT